MGSGKSCSDLVSQCAEELGNVRRRHRRRVTDSEGKRSERAFMLAQFGELFFGTASSGRSRVGSGEFGNSRSFETETCAILRSVARQHFTPHPSFGIRVGFRPTETLMAFLDDVYAVTPSPDRVGAIYTSIQENLWVHVERSRVETRHL